MKQLRQENVATRARYNKIKDYEHKIVHMGSNFQDYSMVKTLLEEKDKEILALKKKTKIHNVQPVQTPELMIS